MESGGQALEITMELGAIIGRMERTPSVLRVMVGGLPEFAARRRGPNGAWSILEIVNHLADEESEDFRARVRSTLEDPSRPWAGIDPERAAIERAYQSRDLDESLARFTREREESIGWLRSLREPDWSRAYHHPTIGDIRAGDLMASWAAHDPLHIRQIAKRLYELGLDDAPGFSTEYAGKWGA